MILTPAQIRTLLDRCTWAPIYEDERLVVARKQSGYNDDIEIAKIQAALSIMLEAAVKRG